MRSSLIGLFLVEIVLSYTVLRFVSFFSLLYHRVCGNTVTRYELMTLFFIIILPSLSLPHPALYIQSTVSCLIYRVDEHLAGIGYG